MSEVLVPEAGDVAGGDPSLHPMETSQLPEAPEPQPLSMNNTEELCLEG